MNRGPTPIRPMLLGLALALAAQPAGAHVTMPSIFGDHMVLQRDQADKVWGHAHANEDVHVQIAGQTKTTKADDEGAWSVKLDPMPAGGPHVMTVKSGAFSLKFEDVLVGEVWICSGQSNMALAVAGANDGDLESKAADHPQIRLISVPQVGTQEPQDDFEGKWETCSPETVRDFSAVGYFFGRQLQQTLDVPIGLIDDAWGGSACEAWIRRDLLEADEAYAPLMDRWKKTEGNVEQAMAEFEKTQAAWRARVEKAKAEGKQPPRAPQSPEAVLKGNHRPANIYNGVLKPTIGYGIRGAIWYQGESNAGRAYQYRDLFPLMIKSWRDEWGIGEFPFYWDLLADFTTAASAPGVSEWAELRSAQTMTLDRLPNTGQAVIVDLGEAQDIHPRNKQDVAKRLARWALARDYGIDVPYQSPTYGSMETDDGKIVVSLENVGEGLKAFDVPDLKGFTISGSDRQFVPAEARIVGRDKVEVWSDTVSDPVAVRYAWADNPVCNLYSRAGLPVTPFRTDDWPGVTADEK